MSKWNFCFCSWRKHNLIYKRQLSNTIWFIKENYRISIKALSLHSWGSLPLLPTAVLPLISCLADQLEQVLHTGMPKKTFSLVPLHPRLPPSKDPSIPPHFLHRTSWRPAQYQICLTWELIYWMEGFNEQQGNQKKKPLIHCIDSLIVQPCRELQLWTNPLDNCCNYASLLTFFSSGTI